MLQACEDIMDFTRSMASSDDLEKDRRTFLAVIRSLEIVGEAARQMPKSFREKHPEIPWREAISLRTVIAHEYFGLDNQILWDVIKTRIPVLFEQIKSIRIE
ncbi:MAG: DUF86 domain-containing protein [Anaerolineales bacterium]|jgi:uncharacterized protein with HEPN domain|nr:DUF86 domain-containing protein [Anaerolineales bacterium]